MGEITRTTPLADLPELCRAEEVAAYFGVSKGIVYEMVKRGVLPSVKLGRLLRIKRDGLVSGGEGEVISINKKGI